MRSDIFAKMAALGCQFAGSDSTLEVDPERTILEALDFFGEDKKIFTMLIGLLKYRLFGLINIKRLLKLSDEIDGGKKILLAVIAIKVFRHSKDKRFLLLHEALKAKCKRSTLTVPSKYQDPFYLNRRGVDKDFKRHKIVVADFFDDQPERKFKPLKRIISENRWLRLRALIGPEYRADVIHLCAEGKAKSQSEATRILGCHKSSISRIWSSIVGVDDLVFALELGIK